MHKSLYIIHPFCIFIHYYSSRSKWCCCSFKLSRLIFKRFRGWSERAQLGLIEFNWWASVELDELLRWVSGVLQPNCLARRPVVLGLMPVDSFGGWRQAPPPRDTSFYLCVTVGQPAAVTEIRIHLDVFTITVLRWLPRVYSPKMCYRMPSRYHLVSYYAIFPLYNKGCRHIFGACIVVSLQNHYMSEKPLSYKDISG